MGLPISISAHAEHDLAIQYRWYADHGGRDIAEAFMDAFDLTLSRLASQPELGKPRKFRAQELHHLRSWAVAGSYRVHLIFYRATEEGVSIERVMHGARDLPRRLVEVPGGGG